MQASVSGPTDGVRNPRKARLLAGGALAALTLAGGLSSPASAANYTAADATELQNAINAAVLSGQASTITLTASFVAQPTLPTTVPITLDTNGFTLTGIPGGSNVSTVFVSGVGQTATIRGVIAGADDPAGLAGNQGLRLNNASVINDGSIKGGVGTFSSLSNTGVVMGGGGTLVNNGTITGGDPGASTVGGLGMQMTGTPTIVSTLVNNGLVQGGDTSGKVAGSGMIMGSPTGRTALINNGTIRGGSDLTGVAAGSSAIRMTGVITGFTNTGTIEGGNGAVAITALGIQTLTLVNSGVIRAGVGQAVAISGPSGVGRSLTLELQAGSAIQGAVTANASGTNDILRLGGNANDTFDVSTIGPQYQDFDFFEKTGTSAWTLTGTGTTATPWTIQQGTLQIGDGGTSGSIIGDVTDNGVLAFNRSDTATFSGVISGSGAVEQRGAGVTVLSGTNTYAGGTAINGGALRISSDGNLGDLAGGLSFNGGALQTSANLASARTITLAGAGTLAPDAGTTLTLSGAISGAGALTQAGPGTSLLSGSNTYTGGTAVNGGALQVSGDANLGAASGGLSFGGGTLQNTATFSSARTITLNAGGGSLRTDADLTLSGVASGAGGLTKTGTGALILTGAGSYAGGTTIAAGTLQLGNGGTSGSITGPVANGGTLAFNRSDAVGFAGAISGAGAVRQVGPGTTTLSGVNTYSGGTTVSAGTLRGSATSFGSGAITDNAALVIDQPTDAAFANAINGSGGFTKTGAGRLNYTGVGSLSGPTVVAAGTLAVNGSLAQSAVEVRSGASLGGNGVVGATTIRTGGAAAPGNSIGTLHVAGNFIQEAGSTYQVELDPDTNASDLIAVTGTATLQPGAGLNVTKTTGANYRSGAVYPVLTAAGGLSGTYTLSGAVGPLSAFLSFQATYDANTAYLKIVQTSDPGGVAETPNQGAVAGGLPGTPVETPVLNSQSPNQARSLLDQLSGDGHAGAKGVLVNDSRMVRDLAIDRLRDVLCAEGNADARIDDGACPNDPGHPALWGQAFSGWGQTEGSANAGNVSRATSGFLIGLDMPVGKLGRLGYFGGYSRGDFGLHARSGNADVDGYHLGLYGGVQPGRLGFRFGAVYSWQDIRATRQVVLPNLSNYLRSEYDARAAQAFVEVGQRLDLGRVSVEPFLGAAYVSVRTSAFQEWGGAAALSARSDEIHNSFATLGVRPSAHVEIGSVKAVVRGLAGWRHAFGDVAPTQTVAFSGGPDFIVQGAAIARDAGVADLGLDLRLGGSGTFGFTYGGQYAARVVDQSVRGQFTFRF